MVDVIEVGNARIHRWVTGPFAENSYLIVCTKTGTAAVVDPGHEVLREIDAVWDDAWTMERVLLTHAHVDHIMGLADVDERFGVPIHCHRDDAFFVERYVESASAFGLQVEPAPMPTEWWDDGDRVTLGELVFEIVHAPGHSPGSVLLKFDGGAFSGDVVMGYSIGRTDLPMGSMETLVKSILERVYTLPEETILFPGHMDPTRVGEEKKHNQFVRPD